MHPILGTNEVRNLEEINWEALKYAQTESWADVCQEQYNMIVKLGCIPSQSTIGPRKNTSLAEIAEDRKSSHRSSHRSKRQLSKHASTARQSAIQSKQKISFAEEESSVDAPRVTLEPLKQKKKKKRKRVNIVNESLESGETTPVEVSVHYTHRSRKKKSSKASKHAPPTKDDKISVVDDHDDQSPP